MMEILCKSYFVSFAWGVCVASVLTSALENVLCWWVGGSQFHIPCWQKERKTHIVFQFLLIYEFKLAVCFSSPFVPEF